MQGKKVWEVNCCCMIEFEAKGIPHSYLKLTSTYSSWWLGVQSQFYVKYMVQRIFFNTYILKGIPSCGLLLWSHFCNSNRETLHVCIWQ
jgi:hypothetical protein